MKTKPKLKLLLLLPVVLLLLGGAYKFVLAKPHTAKAEPKVAGEVYVLGKQFLVNLADGKFAQLTVGLVLAHGESAAGAEGAHGAEAAKPPEGFGPMPQEAVVRDVITDELTGLEAGKLVEGKSRAKVKQKIAHALEKQTDVHVAEVLFTDVTVQ